MFRNEQTLPAAMQKAQNQFIAKTFLWMFAGLLVTAIVAWYTYSSGLFYRFYFSNSIATLAIAEIAVVLIFSFLFRKLPPMVVGVLFFAYAVLNGVTMSVIFAVYQMSSIVVLFFGAAALFGGFALYGYTYKGDLSRWGRPLMITLLIALVMSLINLFLIRATFFEIFIDCAVLFLFFGITVYDLNQIKQLSNVADGSRKLHIYGAMQLYLDFINIFLRLLALFGKSKN